MILAGELIRWCFFFGKPLAIVSKASDKERASEIEAVLSHLFEANGGSDFFRQLAQLGSVYGFVDVVLRLPLDSAGSGSLRSKPFFGVLDFSGTIVLEAIKAARSLPILDENQYRKMLFYVQHFW
jgi:hypothetical protein